MENNNMEISDKESLEIMSKDQSQPEDHLDGDGQFSGQFNIVLLNDHLKKCIRESDHEVDMDEYINTFQQLYKWTQIFFLNICTFISTIFHFNES